MEFIVPYKESISLMWVLSLLGQNIGEGNGTPLQYSCLENPMGGGAWEAAVHGVAKSRTWLSDFTFTFHFHELEKDMATHSSVLAWRIPGTVEPGGLPSMGSHRVGPDLSDLATAAAFTEFLLHVPSIFIYHLIWFLRCPSTAYIIIITPNLQRRKQNPRAVIEFD